jgi:hypothetical protein
MVIAFYPMMFERSSNAAAHKNLRRGRGPRQCTGAAGSTKAVGYESGFSREPRAFKE